MNTYVPGAYTVVLKPSKRIEEIRQEMPVMAYDLVFFTNKDLPEDTVYKITKAMYENKKVMASVFKALNGFQPKGMAKDFGSALQYHPGAIKFYKEKGMWPPKAGS